MEISNLLDELEQLIEKSWGVPLSGGKCLVDAQRLLEVIDDVRANIPEEIRKSQEILEKEKRILETARSTGDTIIQKAEERVKLIVDEQEIVRISRQKGKEIIANAQQKEREIKQGAYEYVESMMSKMETSLIKCVSDIKDIRATVHAQKLSDKNKKT